MRHSSLRQVTTLIWKKNFFRTYQNFKSVKKTFNENGTFLIEL